MEDVFSYASKFNLTPKDVYSILNSVIDVSYNTELDEAEFRSVKQFIRFKFTKTSWRGSDEK